MPSGGNMKFHNRFHKVSIWLNHLLSPEMTEWTFVISITRPWCKEFPFKTNLVLILNNILTLYIWRMKRRSKVCACTERNCFLFRDLTGQSPYCQLRGRAKPTVTKNVILFCLDDVILWKIMLVNFTKDSYITRNLFKTKEAFVLCLSFSSKCSLR